MRNRNLPVLLGCLSLLTACSIPGVLSGGGDDPAGGADASTVVIPWTADGEAPTLDSGSSPGEASVDLTPPIKPDAAKPAQPDAAKPTQPDAAPAKPDASAPPPKLDAGTPPPTSGKTYYVRPGGGSSVQCTGLVNADYPGSGTSKPCALKHPFYALSPTGKVLLKGGDTLFIGAGSYRMGYGAPGASGCVSAYPWDCVMPAIPSGPSAAQPTRILGQGYDSGCKSAPSLYGVERADQLLDLNGSSHVQIACLELTDHSGCVDGHSGSIKCDRSSYPYGDWTGTGIVAKDSTDVQLRHLNIHGLAHTGIHAGRLKDWTLEDVTIAGNGWVGFDGDLAESKGSSNSGTITFRRVTISYNGCGETYPGGKPSGCWGQTAGGYGDGLGTAATGGDWVFEDCRVLHNTSDGIDLLYHTLGGSITVRRMRAEGNAGNQLKVTGASLVENSVLIGNCAYFAGQPFTYNVDNCRALGNTVAVVYTGGESITLVNNTIYGQGDVLVETGARAGYSCKGTEKLTAINNIFVGDTEFHSPTDKSALFYNDGCPGLTFGEDFSVIHNVKNGCPKTGASSLCADPLLTTISGGSFVVLPKAGSPAVDSGKAVGGVVPGKDFFGYKRPVGQGVDRGACELGGK
jgi:Right handed beta helix region